MSIDLINRDPNNINGHVQCSFEDVLAEPEGVRSIDCVWTASYTCFECWKGCCYKLATLCCGLCIAAELGCEFASVAFLHVWSYTPTLRLLAINCTYFKRYNELILSCCLEPCCMACGQIFHAFKRDKN